LQLKAQNLQRFHKPGYAGEAENERFMILVPQRGRGMEKISIARRRRNGAFEPRGQRQSDIDSQLPHGPELIEIPFGVLDQSPKCVREEPYRLEGSDKDIDEAISVNLTPEQYDLIKSNRYVNYFLNGDSTGVSLDIQKHTEGQIIFNFQFKKVDIVKMLKAKHVCQMLQISNSLLMNLVKSKKIRSYRIGRLRRFLLQDVLDYLSKSEELTESSES
jgi:excisionase family DNA binding protein